MRAIVFESYGGAEQLVLREVSVPEPRDGEIRIAVRAFGVNRAEIHMRSGHWGEVSRISGIECVGTVDADPSGVLSRGDTVAALVGGMGRDRPGSYAEYTCVPASNVVALRTQLPWADLAAVPESYATAWGALFGNLHLKTKQILLVRGATSALGQAAVNIAADLGAVVLASTRRREHVALLERLGASHVLIEDGALASTVRAKYPDGLHAVLDIVGNRTLRDSLSMTRRGGRVCQVGFLGGADPVEAFNPLFDMPSGVDLNFYATGLVLGTPLFPLSEIPLQTIVDSVAAGRYRAAPARVFPFEQLADAHRLMESDQATGKIVVVM